MSREKMNACKELVIDAGVWLDLHGSCEALGLFLPLKPCSCNDSVKNENFPGTRAFQCSQMLFTSLRVVR